VFSFSVHTILCFSCLDKLTQVVQNRLYVVNSSVKKVFESKKTVLGQYENRVNEKQQVAFPKKFRDVLGDSLVITKGFDGNLVGVAEQDWEELVQGTEGILFADRKTREIQRFFLGNATVVELDSQGRFVLPEYLRTHANIGKDVVFVGIRNFVEIWDKKTWDNHQNGLSSTISDLTAYSEKKMNE
jgi:MraZ protein